MRKFTPRKNNLARGMISVEKTQERKNWEFENQNKSHISKFSCKTVLFSTGTTRLETALCGDF